MATRIKTQKQKEFSDISEVKTVFTQEECNKLLKDGWVLLSIGLSHVDGMGYNAKPTFIMGLTK
jgi:hypothetical protein